MQKTTTYQEQSRIFLAQAHEELNNGDQIKACEYGWKAAAHMLKAVADKRGWEHEDERDLFDIVEMLLIETGDSELATLFACSHALETNSHERWDPVGLTKSQLSGAEGFVDKLEVLLDQTT